ncbi:hypothetical protein OAM67_00040 [bacterium]|nr:hypothetical protein [bacterium]
MFFRILTDNLLIFLFPTLSTAMDVVVCLAGSGKDIAAFRWHDHKDAIDPLVSNYVPTDDYEEIQLVGMPSKPSEQFKYLKQHKGRVRVARKQFARSIPTRDFTQHLFMAGTTRVVCARNDTLALFDVEPVLRQLDTHEYLLRPFVLLPHDSTRFWCVQQGLVDNVIVHLWSTSGDVLRVVRSFTIRDVKGSPVHDMLFAPTTDTTFMAVLSQGTCTVYDTFNGLAKRQFHPEIVMGSEIKNIFLPHQRLVFFVGNDGFVHHHQVSNFCKRQQTLNCSSNTQHWVTATSVHCGNDLMLMQHNNASFHLRKYWHAQRQTMTGPSVAISSFQQIRMATQLLLNRFAIVAVQSCTDIVVYVFDKFLQVHKSFVLPCADDLFSSIQILTHQEYCDTQPTSDNVGALVQVVVVCENDMLCTPPFRVAYSRFKTSNDGNKAPKSLSATHHSQWQARYWVSVVGALALTAFMWATNQ